MDTKNEMDIVHAQSSYSNAHVSRNAYRSLCKVVIKIIQ